MRSRKPLKKKVSIWQEAAARGYLRRGAGNTQFHSLAFAAKMQRAVESPHLPVQGLLLTPLSPQRGQVLPAGWSIEKGLF